MAAKENIIIDLDNAQHAMPLLAESILHNEQLKILSERIKNIVQHISAFKEQLKKDRKPNSVGYERYHDVITLYGKRGSGKTTFLLSSLSLLCNGSDKIDKDFDEIRKKLLVLDILDPTLFGLHDHLLHTILGKIAKAVRQHAATHEISFIKNTDSSYIMENWEKSLVNLAKGLKYAGETRDDLKSYIPSETVDWMDSEFLLEKGMDSACNGVNLERNFHHFLHDSLAILGKDAFVLGLDDIDTRPSIGWHVLEVIRRYFTSPQLIVIIAGDMDLFKTLIEKQQLAIFGLDFKSDLSVLNEFRSRVDGLTEQYLLKILRTPNRIRLGDFSTALNQLNEKKVDISIHYDNNKNVSLNDFLMKYFDPLFAYSLSVGNRLYRQILLANPVRSVVQVFYGLPKDVPQRIRALCDVFFVSLQGMGIQQPDKLMDILPTAEGIPFIMRQFFTNGSVSRGFDLLPRLGKGEENNALLALHAALAYAMRNNYYVFWAYLFKACLLREVLIARYPNIEEIASEYTNIAEIASEYTNIEDFLKIDSGEPTSTTAERISVLYVGDKKGKSELLLGMLYMYKNVQTEKVFNEMYKQFIGSNSSQSQVDNTELQKNFVDTNSIKEFYNKYQQNQKVDTSKRSSVAYCFLQILNGKHGKINKREFISTTEDLIANINSWQKNIVSLGTIDICRGNKSFRIFSIFPLLGVIGDIIDNPKHLNIVFEQYKEIPTYYTYETSNLIIQEDDEIDDDIVIDEVEHNEIENKFFDMLSKWALSIKKNNFQVSPVICTRIIARLLSALRGINNRSVRENILMGEYIHHCLVAFFNSILVEEYLLTLKEDEPIKISSANPSLKDDTFIYNLKRIGILEQRSNDTIRVNVDNVNTRLPLFTFLFRCPLWGLYLNPISSEQPNSFSIYAIYKAMLQQEESELTKIYKVSYSSENIEFDNLYCLLNSLAVQRK